MTISKDNTRVQVTMPKELKSKLENMAEDDTRTVSNIIVAILNNYVKSTHDDE